VSLSDTQAQYLPLNVKGRLFASSIGPVVVVMTLPSISEVVRGADLF